jgi:hypothetical protein
VSPRPLGHVSEYQLMRRGCYRLPSEPEKIYKLLYHNNDFLESIWKEEGFKGTSGVPRVRPGTNDSSPISSFPASVIPISSRLALLASPQTSKCNPGPTANVNSNTPDPSAVSARRHASAARRSFIPRDKMIGSASRARRRRPVCRAGRGEFQVRGSG